MAEKSSSSISVALSISEHIRLIRERRNLSQEYLAEKLGVSRQTLHRAEKGLMNAQRLEKLHQQLLTWEKSCS